VSSSIKRTVKVPECPQARSPRYRYEKTSRNMRVKAPNQTANFAPWPLSLPIFLSPIFPSDLLQHLLDLGDELVAINDAEARVGQVALLVVNERGGKHAGPVLVDFIKHLLRILSVLQDNVELHLLLFDKRDDLRLDVVGIVGGDAHELHALVTIFRVERDQFREFRH